MKCMQQGAKDAKRAAAKASKAAKAASSSSSPSCAGASGGGGADAHEAEDVENDETGYPDFDSSPSLSDGDVASLLTSIADFRFDVPNAEEESDLLSFLAELERADSD